MHLMQGSRREQDCWQGWGEREGRGGGRKGRGRGRGRDGGEGGEREGKGGEGGEGGGKRREGERRAREEDIGEKERGRYG